MIKIENSWKIWSLVSMVIPRLPVNADDSIMVKKIIANGQLVAGNPLKQPIRIGLMKVEILSTKCKDGVCSRVRRNCKECQTRFKG